MIKENDILNKRYRVIKKIGEGGMASVYLAKDLYLERNVAIKCLKIFQDQENNKRNFVRFQREIEALSRLVNHNVARIYDVVNFEDDDKNVYIVMEYVSSTDLKQVIKKRAPLYYVEVVRIFKEICNCIEEAHEKNIIHRDLKPHNILISDDGVVKIVDFGISLINDGIEITASNNIVGSIQYIAPEILQGQQPSFQSDIYALGIILFEMLIGKPPFNDRTIQAIANKHINEIIPSVKKFNFDIPEAFDVIIRKTTSKNLNIRYKTVKEMLNDINFLMDHNQKNNMLVQKTVSDVETRHAKSNINMPPTVFVKNWFLTLMIGFFVVEVVILILLVLSLAKVISA